MSLTAIEAEFASAMYDHVFNHPNHPPSENLLAVYQRDRQRASRQRRLRHREVMQRSAPIVFADPEFARGWPPGRKPGVGRTLRRLGYSRGTILLPQDTPRQAGCSAPFQQLAQRTSQQGYMLGSDEQEFLFPSTPYESYGGYDYYLESVRTIAKEGLFSIAGFTNDTGRPEFSTFGNAEGLVPEASMRQGFYLPELSSLDPAAVLVTAHLSRDSFGGVEGCWQPGRPESPGQGLLWPFGLAELTVTLYDGFRLLGGEQINSQTATGKELLISALIYGDPNGRMQTADEDGVYNYTIDVLQGDRFLDDPNGFDVQVLIKRPLAGAIFLVAEVSVTYYFLKWTGNPLSGIGLENRLPLGQVQLAVPGDPYDLPSQPICLDSVTVCAL